MIPFVIEMRGQAQVSSKQTAQTQKRLDELSKRRPEVHPAVNDLCTSCVQEGGFEGPENGPKQRRINNRLLSYRPQHRRGNVHNSLIVRWFSVFRNCAYGAGDGNRTHVRSLGSLQFNSKNAGLAAFLRFSERLNWKIMENGN